MPISEERKKIYRKLRKLGFHTASNNNSLSLHRWKNAKIKKKESNKEKVITHDSINIYIDKNDIYLIIYSENIYIILKHNQIFDINNFELSNYNWYSNKRAISLNKEELRLLDKLYHEIILENGLNISNIYNCDRSHNITEKL